MCPAPELLAALTLSCADVHADVPPAGTVGVVVGAIVVTGAEDDVDDEEEDGAFVGCDDALDDL